MYTCELRLRRLVTTYYTEARASPPLETLRKMDVKIQKEQKLPAVYHAL